MKDNVNLYTYVANSPINYVDRMGMEKVLILIGTEKRDGEFTDIAEYYKQKYLQNGIKERNILIRHNISSTSAFNDITCQYQDNIDSVIWITHARRSGLDASKSINQTNINEINLINTKPMCTNQGSITLVGCNAGGGNNPIAAQLSNETGVPVTAANNFILPTIIGDLSQSDNLAQEIFDTIASNLVYGSIGIAHERGEPTLLLGLGSWKTFNPN